MRFSMRFARAIGVFSIAFLVAACGSDGAATTEGGAIDNFRAVLATYNSARPNDVTTTGSQCGQALSDLRNADYLARPPVPGKDLPVRRHVREAYLEARQGFSDCSGGAKTMSYVTMARGAEELARANVSLQRARTGAK